MRTVERMMTIFGIDIGGTSCSVVRASAKGNVEAAIDFPTGDCDATLARIGSELDALGADDSSVFGVACGDPLDIPGGLICAPPNLPGWNRVPMVALLEQRFGGRAYLMNDANAGALAEWTWGAGQGCRHMIFLTMGTGFGAGMIFNGALYEGACFRAGEIGHTRLTDAGPVGYGKAGSVEGWCSGGGIAQLARDAARARGGDIAFCHGEIDAVTAKDVADAIRAGDPLACELFDTVGRCLGQTLSRLIDILNPERIVIGSLFVRCRELLEPAMREVLEAETLPEPLAACEIVPAALGESLGHRQAIAVAVYCMEHARPA